MIRFPLPTPQRIPCILRRNRKNLSQMIGKFPTSMLLPKPPLLWIAQGDLFESNAVDDACAGNMEMS